MPRRSGRQGRARSDALAGARMAKRQCRRVQEESLVVKSRVAALPVAQIVDDRVSDRSQVHANLMRASRFETKS